MPKITFICEVCGKEFQRWKCQLRKGIFCSHKCYWIELKKRQKGIRPVFCDSPPWNKGTKGICKAWNKGKKLPQFSGVNHPRWKGGKMITRGYIRILTPNHPFCLSSGYILEHHLVMEKYLRRYLKPGEVVHHINGNKSDNRLENLMLFPNDSAHQSYHHYIKKLKT